MTLVSTKNSLFSFFFFWNSHVNCALKTLKFDICFVHFRFTLVAWIIKKMSNDNRMIFKTFLQRFVFWMSQWIYTNYVFRNRFRCFTFLSSMLYFIKSKIRTGGWKICNLDVYIFLFSRTFSFSDRYKFFDSSILYINEKDFSWYQLTVLCLLIYPEYLATLVKNHK